MLDLNERTLQCLKCNNNDDENDDDDDNNNDDDDTNKYDTSWNRY